MIRDVNRGSFLVSPLSMSFSHLCSHLVLRGCNRQRPNQSPNERTVRIRYWLRRLPGCCFHQRPPQRKQMISVEERQSNPPARYMVCMFNIGTFQQCPYPDFHAGKSKFHRQQISLYCYAAQEPRSESGPVWWSHICRRLAKCFGQVGRDERNPCSNDDCHLPKVFPSGGRRVSQQRT